MEFFDFIQWLILTRSSLSQDFVSLVIQAVGGGMAATASDLNQQNLVNNNGTFCFETNLLIYLSI